MVLLGTKPLGATSMRPETRHCKGPDASSATNCETNEEVQEEHTDGEVHERPNGDEVPERHPDADATEHDGALADVSSGHPADPGPINPPLPLEHPVREHPKLTLVGTLKRCSPRPRCSRW